MITKNQILEKLKNKKPFLQKEYSVDKIGIFGSFAKDSQTDSSDIDFYVEFKNKSFDNLSGLWIYLESLYGRKIDILHKHKNNNKVIFNNIQKEVIFG